MRQAKNLTPKELAKGAGISLSYLRKIENGHCPHPHAKTLARISSFFGVWLKVLLEESEDSGRVVDVDNVRFRDLPNTIVGFVVNGQSIINSKYKSTNNLPNYLELLEQHTSGNIKDCCIIENRDGNNIIRCLNDR
jgi:transcriptional regulator with XRE-family HTH domain